MPALVNWGGGTLDSAIGGTFQSDTGGTFHSDTPGTFESDMDGTFKVSQSNNFAEPKATISEVVHLKTLQKVHLM